MSRTACRQAALDAAAIMIDELEGGLSSNGAMVRIQGKGWKEVKAAAISQVEVLPTAPRRKGEKR